MSFRITALPYHPFAPLFAADPATLAAARAQLVAGGPGMPCRVSLQDAVAGERVLLVNHAHLPVDTPFRAAHAIYVREGAVQAEPAVGAVPNQLRRRLLSVRAFDAAGMMLAADVVEGTAVEPVIAALLTPDAAFLHLHFAKQGCYAARVDRA